MRSSAAPQGARSRADPVVRRLRPWPGGQKDWSTVRSEKDEELTPFEDVTSYNNYYEFGTQKDDPVRNAHTLEPRPWTIQVGGMCANPGVYGLEDFIQPGTMEDRIYRMRCVEAWSMVIPWYGFALKDVIDHAAPLGSARYVEFKTLHDPQQMPGQRGESPGLALCRRPAPGRGAPPADDSGNRCLRSGSSQPKWGAHPACGAVEIWVQGHQVHREHDVHRARAA